MLSLKNILSVTKGRIPFLKQERFATIVNDLAKESRAAAPYNQRKIIEASLQNACRTYQNHQRLFIRQWLHNNANLTNFLVDKETVYTLDLSHIREDYALSDLASLVISCLFLEIPATTIKTIVKDYVTQHKMESEHLLILNTLVTIGLIREYLKNVRREKSVDLAIYSPDIVRTYRSHLSARKESIAAVLKGINDISTLIV
jgi:Ser/Thr protein kinase RdoA (MazF antagonist)